MHKKVHSSDSYTSRILNFIKTVDGNITTTSEIASNLKISWNTAEKKLLELVIENKVMKIKKIGVNLWVLKK